MPIRIELDGIYCNNVTKKLYKICSVNKSIELKSLDDEEHLIMNAYTFDEQYSLTDLNPHTINPKILLKEAGE